MSDKPAIASFEEARDLCPQRDPATKDYVLQQVMYRIKDPCESLKFYIGALGMTLVDKLDFPPMKFSVYLLNYDNPNNVPKDKDARYAWMMKNKSTIIELTHNWGTEKDPNFSYHNGNSEPRGFGHIGIVVPDLDKACARFEKLGVKFIKKPTDGTMKTIAFVADPDGYWVEVLTSGPAPIVK